jgi:hypothetical protein
MQAADASKKKEYGCLEGDGLERGPEALLLQNVSKLLPDYMALHLK